MSANSNRADPDARFEPFGRFRISRDSEGQPIELPGPEGEFVCLASDPDSSQLVELHIPKSRPKSIEDFAKRLDLARKLAGETAFVSILDTLKHEDEIAYTTHVNRGEPLASYVERNGTLGPAIGLGLVVEFLEKFLATRPRFESLLATANFSNLLIFRAEDASVGLRMIDFGLSAGRETEFSLGGELRGLLALCLTGVRPGQTAFAEVLEGPLLANLPSNAAALISGSRRFTELETEQLLAALREDLHSVTSLSDRNRRDHLKICRQTSPRAAIETALTPNPALPDELSARFIADWRGVGFDTAFAVSAMDSTNGGRVRVQILPPERVHPGSPSPTPQSADALQLLRVLEAWEGDEATWVAEEGWPGFPLSLVLATKGRLTATETLIALRQVALGIEQAQRHSVEIPDLRPANLVVCFPATTNQSDLRKNLERRLDCWPSFVIKIRTQATTLSLLEPPHQIERALVNASVNDSENERLKRRFLALAIELLTGGTGELPTESLPPALMDLFVECGRKMQSGERLPEPEDVLENFADALPEAPPELAAVTWSWADYSNAKSQPIPAPAPAAADSVIDSDRSTVVLPPSPFTESARLVNSFAVPAPSRPAAHARPPEPVDLELEDQPRRPRRARVVPQPGPIEIATEFAPLTEAEAAVRLRIGDPAPFDPAPVDDAAIAAANIEPTEPSIELAPMSSRNSGRLGKIAIGLLQLIAIVVIPIVIFIGYVRQTAGEKPETKPPAENSTQASTNQP